MLIDIFVLYFFLKENKAEIQIKNNDDIMEKNFKIGI